MKPASAFLSGIGRDSSRQATQPGYPASNRWHPRRSTSDRTPRSSRSSPTERASSSTEARRPSSSACCRPTSRGATDDLWGTWALYRAPETVVDVHRSYVAAGCDVISTNTWSVLADAQGGSPGTAGLLHWMDIARTGIRLARTAAAEASSPRAVAFSLSEDAESLARSGTTRLLSKIFDDEPPDLILLETLSLVREPETFDARRGPPRARAARLGVVSPLPPRRLRRLRPALGPAGGRSLRPRCAPPRGDGRRRASDQLPARRPRARDGRAGSATSPSSRSASTPTSATSPATAGASTSASTRRRTRPSRSSGGRKEHRSSAAAVACTPEHIAAAATALEGTVAGRSGSHRIPSRRDGDAPPSSRAGATSRVASLYPLPFPDLAVEPGVFVPTQGSYLLWKHLAANGRRQRTAAASTSAAGAASSRYSSRSTGRPPSTRSTSTAAPSPTRSRTRSETASSDRVSGDTVDLFQWEPHDRFDLIAASLYQMPVDPYEEPSGHRPLDFWGRNLFDRFLALLPELLTPTGRALVLQLSILGQVRDGGAPRHARARGPRRRLQLLPLRRGLRVERAADRSRRGALRRAPPRVREATT